MTKKEEYDKPLAEVLEYDPSEVLTASTDPDLGDGPDYNYP